MAALLSQEQKRKEMNPRKLSIPVATRWNTFYNCLDRLLYSYECLQSLCCEKRLLQYCNVKELGEIKDLVLCDKFFWPVLRLLHNLLKPLFVTISLIEGDLIETSKALAAVKRCLDEVGHEIGQADEAHQTELFQVMLI